MSKSQIVPDNSVEIDEKLDQIRAVSDLLMGRHDLLLDDTIHNAGWLIERLTSRVIELRGGAS